MTIKEAATWLGVPKDAEDDDLELLLYVPRFRRACGFVAAGTHKRIWDDPSAAYVWEKFHLPTNRNGDLDIEWLRDLAIKLQRGPS